MTKAFYPVVLLTISNIFMTFAWYGHLKYKHKALWIVILVSWGIAFFEYCAQVPANRLGFQENGGPFSMIQLKVIQEVISLVMFSIISSLLLRGGALHWNHFMAFLCLILAVFFVFLKA
jgi:uncharacterized protein (DUF486 family)